MRRNDFFKYLLFGGGGSASRSELESETLPYTFVSKSQRLRNCRIYGNTVDGESVGDLVETGEHTGEYLVPITVNDTTTDLYLPEQLRMVGNEAEYVDCKKQKLHRVRRNLCDNDNLLIGFYSASGAFNNDSNFRTSNFIAVHPNTNYTVSFFKNGIRTGSLVTIFWNQFKQVIQEISTGTFTTPQNCEYITIRNFSSQSSALVNDYAFQVEKGSAATEYEPYIENDEIDVVIPALPIAEGTNTLSIGTAVQPSKIWIQGNISEIETVSVQALQANMQILQPFSLDENLGIDVMQTDNDLQPDVMQIEKPVLNLNNVSEIENAEIERGVESAE